jgi:hypothetical protein
LPRDTTGRLLLLVVAGLAANLLAPWSIVYGQRQTMMHLGAPAWGLVALFALAALPLVRPAYRQEPLISVLPLVVGTFCAGIGAMYWLLLFRENEQASAISAPVPLNGSIVSAPGVVIAPDVGLYLFLLGSAVLAVIGYQLFLAAAASRTATTAATLAATPRAPQPATAANAGQAGVTVASIRVAGASLGVVGASQTLAPSSRAEAGAAAGAVPGQPGGIGLIGQNDQNGHVPILAAAPGVEHEAPASRTSDSGVQVVLPGSPAWTEPPQQPTVIRHSAWGGWQRPPSRWR